MFDVWAAFLQIFPIRSEEYSFFHVLHMQKKTHFGLVGRNKKFIRNIFLFMQNTNWSKLYHEWEERERIRVRSVREGNKERECIFTNNSFDSLILFHFFQESFMLFLVFAVSTTIWYFFIILLLSVCISEYGMMAREIQKCIKRNWKKNDDF